MSAHASTPDDACQHQRPEGGGGGCDGYEGPVEVAHGVGSGGARLIDGRLQVLVQPLQSRIPGVVDMPVGELRQPGVADLGACGDLLPITPAHFERSADFCIK